MANASDFGAFVPTTYLWDMDQLKDVDVNSKDFKELLLRLYQNVNLMANVLNVKDTGYYDTNEFVCGQNYFADPSIDSSSIPSRVSDYRNVFRKVINFGALPTAAASPKSVPHGIALINGNPNMTSSYTCTRIYGTANDTTALTYLPLPYASATVVANNIEVSVDNTNVTIAVGVNRNNFDTCYIVLEYLKF